MGGASAGCAGKARQGGASEARGNVTAHDEGQGAGQGDRTTREIASARRRAESRRQHTGTANQGALARKQPVSSRSHVKRQAGGGEQNEACDLESSERPQERGERCSRQAARGDRQLQDSAGGGGGVTQGGDRRRRGAGTLHGAKGSTGAGQGSENTLQVGMGEGSGGLLEGGKSNKERQCGECKHAYMPAADDQQGYQGDQRGESSAREAPRDEPPKIGAEGPSSGSLREVECGKSGRGSYTGGVAEQNYAGPAGALRKRDGAHTNITDGRQENNPDPSMSGEESDRQNHEGGHRAMKHNDVQVDRKKSKIEREEKKRETGPKPLNINARNAWRCGDQGIRASGPRRNEIKRAKGMARRIKQNQHWAGVCAGMAMAQVYIEPITLETGAAVEGPADRREPFKLFGPPPGGGGGGGGGEGGGGPSQPRRRRQSQAKQRRKKKRKKQTAKRGA